MGKWKKKYKNLKRLYNCFLDENGCVVSGLSPPTPKTDSAKYKPDIPAELRCSSSESGFFFGLDADDRASGFLGMKQGSEGHVLIVGGSGRGKSSGIFMPTLATWKGTFFAIDVKGELSDAYSRLVDEGLASRKYIIFDPLNPESPSFDPFGWLETIETGLLYSAAKEITDSLIPKDGTIVDDFWPESERAVFVACLLYGYKLGLGFSETLVLMMESPLQELLSRIVEDGDLISKFSLNGLLNAEGKTFASIERGLRNKVLSLVSDDHLSHAFRGRREGAMCFDWSHLDEYNIFLRIPADHIDQWEGAVNLMLTQLIRHLERRPDKYATEDPPVETLLVLDEFARFGKVEPIVGAMSTLRSKNVHISLALQSLAQLDSIYGISTRRVLCDNADYTLLLGAYDPDTQKYFAERIGTVEYGRTLNSAHYDEDAWPTGTTEQTSFAREWKVFPEELAYIKDVLLLSPYGFFSFDKLKPMIKETEPVISAIRRALGYEETTMVYYGETHAVDDDHLKPDEQITVLQGICKIVESGALFTNQKARMLSMIERHENTKVKALKLEQEKRRSKREMNIAAEKINSRRHYIIGEMVVKYFPELQSLNPGTGEENLVTFHSLDLFLEYLAANRDIVEQICNEAGCTMLL